MGAAKKQINPDQVFKLARIGCTNEEIGTILGCSADTLERRYAGDLETGRSNRRSSLRRKQFQLAMKGDRTMLIWLGKQDLGQKEMRDVTSHEEGPPKEIVVQIEDNWYGNADRLTAAGIAASVADSTQSGQAEISGMRPPLGQNGNGSNGNGHGPRAGTGGNGRSH
jgi:hypothetical protein